MPRPGPSILAAALAAMALAGGGARAESVMVKLGTMAPDGSPWHLLLQDMGESWSSETGGKVKVKIFPGGIQGNEGDVIRKMRIGQLQAGAVSIVGLRDIDPGPQALATPGMIDSEEELAYVYERVAPVWEKRLEEKGFIVLSWGDTGWGHIFAKRPIHGPKDLDGLKVMAWSGDPGAVEAWRMVGAQPVVISVTDMLPSLSTGMIDGFATAPLLAMTARWYEQTRYMPDVKWGRLAGATIMTTKAWEKIPEGSRAKLLATAREIGRKVNVEVAKMETDSITAMKKNGLEVIEPSAAERAEWQATAEKTWPVIRGGVVPAEDFDLVKRTRDEYRAKKAAGK
jgi:TRAP-type C4-dicarboxylate transport system substrate-binding protein